MVNEILKLMQGEILEEDVRISLSQLCQISRLPAESVLEMVEYGVIEPRSGSNERWQFSGQSLNRLRCAQRLKRDLGVNTAGAALAVELLDELQQLRTRIHNLEKQLY